MYVQIVYYSSPILNVFHCMHYVRPIDVHIRTKNVRFQMDAICTYKLYIIHHRF